MSVFPWWTARRAVSTHEKTDWTGQRGTTGGRTRSGAEGEHRTGEDRGRSLYPGALGQAGYASFKRRLVERYAKGPELERANGVRRRRHPAGAQGASDLSPRSGAFLCPAHAGHWGRSPALRLGWPGRGRQSRQSRRDQARQRAPGRASRFRGTQKAPEIATSEPGPMLACAFQRSWTLVSA